MKLLCDCGFRHEVAPPVQDLIAGPGPHIKVTVEGRTWHVPRLWIAVHGLKGRELAELAVRHGWEPAP
jgi:hypothetical protein